MSVKCGPQPERQCHGNAGALSRGSISGHRISVCFYERERIIDLDDEGGSSAHLPEIACPHSSANEVHD